MKYHHKNIPSVEMLLWNIRFINDRIEQGDIVSAKHAVPIVLKMVHKMSATAKDEGATDLWLSPFVAGGGWVGIIVSYTINGEKLEYSITPRRIGYA